MKFKSKDGIIYNNRVSMLLANIKSKVSSRRNRKTDDDEFLDFEEFDDDFFEEDDDDSDRSIDKHVVEMGNSKIDELKMQALNIAEAKWRHRIKLLCIPEAKPDDLSAEAQKLRKLHMDFYSAASIEDHDTAQKELDEILNELEKEHSEYISYDEDIPIEPDLSYDETKHLYEYAKQVFGTDNVSDIKTFIPDPGAPNNAIGTQQIASGVTPDELHPEIETLNVDKKTHPVPDILDEPIDDIPVTVTEHPVEGSVDVSIFRGYANEDDPELAYKLKRDAERERSMSEEESNDSDEGEQL